MGTDYDASAVVGFLMPSTAFRPFVKITQGNTVIAKRYDRKTGAEIEPESVIIPPSFSILLDGEEFEGGDLEDVGGCPTEDQLELVLNDWYPEDDLLDTLGHLLNANVYLCGDFTGYGYERHIAIEPHGINDVEIEALSLILPELPRIKQKAQELGLDIGEAGIHAILNVS